MTNETAPRAIVSHPPNLGDAAETEYFVIVTVKLRGSSGWVKESHAYVTVVKADTTDDALLEQISGEIPERMRNSSHRPSHRRGHRRGQSSRRHVWSWLFPLSLRCSGAHGRALANNRPGRPA
ncbi:hypothetical protein BKA00_003924 [Actinomadura coerulea]|uniref:Uncharacterized protein n=1 Tax=Actinomadura coerulea TaxID=46159 RepID=A0A7X0G093_9ACTN|nr:hypothetical protein [Actinomadura coerulea]GGP95994.1 hypothetical protein GCM10010187_09520 [Actinomadura coerulea]